MNPKGHNFHDLEPVISVENVDETISRYQNQLGFKIDFTHGNPPVYARVSREKVMVHFAQSDAQYPPSSVKWFFIGLGHVDGSENMDELYEEYCAKGVKVTMPPTVQPYGFREFEIEEPEGIRIRFHVDAK